MKHPVDCDSDIGWKDRMWATVILVVFISFFIALFGSAKKEIVTAAIEEIDVDDIIIIDEIMELPEIETQEALLPEILPPLYEEPLPPLQGEV
jgi:hypothetical protein